jgi:hypothetical protein
MSTWKPECNAKFCPCLFSPSSFLSFTSVNSECENEVQFPVLAQPFLTSWILPDHYYPSLLPLWPYAGARRRGWYEEWADPAAAAAAAVA